TRRRLQVRSEAAAAVARDPAGLPHDRRRAAGREPGALHALVRGSRARDLLPRRPARLLPHARLRPGYGRLRKRPRRFARCGYVDEAGPASRRRPASRSADAEAVPPEQGRRTRPYCPVYAHGAMTRLLVWLGAGGRGGGAGGG